jgi:phosphatidylinositol 3-kinase
MVRTFAVDALRRASDDELVTYLLQLVQALRYEAPPDAGPATATAAGGSGSSSSSSSSSTHRELAGPPTDAADGGGNGSGEARPSFILARFLIERACGSLEMANFLYWYLRVELKDAASGDVFQAVFDEFGRTLREVNPTVLDLLRKQDAFISRIAQAQRRARDEKGRKDGKEAKLRWLLAETALLPPGTLFVPMPLDPQIKVAGVVASSAFMFRSALYPAVIQFRLYHPPADGDEATADGHVAGACSISASVVSTAASFVFTPRSAAGAGSGGGGGIDDSGSNYKVIFKNGDDLRQDQLVIQMVSLMDFLLKRVNLDLKLTPYRILATGARDGMIEFVGRSSPISEVLAKHGTIHDYFRVHYPDRAAPFGVQPDVISTFVKSCAGYCVITYLLGAFFGPGGLARLSPIHHHQPTFLHSAPLK